MVPPLSTKGSHLTLGSEGNALLLATTLHVGKPEKTSEERYSALISCESVSYSDPKTSKLKASVDG